MTRSVTILGSTGSVGRSTLALLDEAPEGAFRIEALVANRDVAGLAIYLLSDAAAMMTGALIDFDQNVMGAYG